MQRQRAAFSNEFSVPDTCISMQFLQWFIKCVKNMLDVLGSSDNGAGQGDAAAWDKGAGEVTVCDTDRQACFPCHID
jgi:hypothetical protein